MLMDRLPPQTRRQLDNLDNLDNLGNLGNLNNLDNSRGVWGASGALDTGPKLGRSARPLPAGGTTRTLAGSVLDDTSTIT